MYTIFHAITATFQQSNHNYNTSFTKPKQFHKIHKHNSYKNFTQFGNYTKLAQKYAFLYETITRRIPKLDVINIWMIHKIEIFPHYTYPLPEGMGDTNLKHPKTKEELKLWQNKQEIELEECDIPEKASTKDDKSHLTSLEIQPYRTCSHYGFNYPMTYQPNIIIHPAHLLTAVQLQREKPRAPRLKSCEVVKPLSSPEVNKMTELHTTPHTNNGAQPTTDSNGSYISVKEIKLKPTKRQCTSKLLSNDHDHKSFTDDSQQHSIQDQSFIQTAIDASDKLTHDDHQHDSLSEHFSSLLSIGGTSYPPGSHSHIGDLDDAHDHDHEDHEKDHENDECGGGGVHYPNHYDDSGDNTSSIYTHEGTPTTQRATPSYLLRDFLPRNAQSREIPEHKPESEQDLPLKHAERIKGVNLLATSTMKKKLQLNNCNIHGGSIDGGVGVGDEESDETHSIHSAPPHTTHHSHKQIKLTLNSNKLKRRCSHSSQEGAAVSVALPTPTSERYRIRHVTTSLSEPDLSPSSSSATSSLRSLEIHININVKNSDCARRLQTHEDEFRRKLERIIDEEINLIAQQLSGSAHYASSNLVESGNGGGGGVPITTNSLLAAHMETLNDLRMVGIGSGSENGARCNKQSKLPQHLQPESQQQQEYKPMGSKYATSTRSAADSTTADANDAYDEKETPPLTQHHRRMLALLEQELESLLNGIICANALHNHAVMCDCKMKVAQISQDLRASLSAGK